MRRRTIRWLLLAMLAADAHAQGVITTIAGSDWVFNGDGMPAANAPLGAPSWIVTDNAGNPVFVDSLNCVVARIGATGTLSVLAGNGFCGFNTGQGGPATSAALNTTSTIAPTSIVFDASGALYISDVYGIRKVAGGAISLFTAYSFNSVPMNGGTALYPQFGNLTGLARDPAGNICAVDVSHAQVYRFSSAGSPTVVAGNGTQGLSGDGGAATSAELSQPSAIAFDSAGNMYIADTGNNRIRKVSSTGVISTLVTGIAGNGLAFDNNDILYIAAGNGIASFSAASGLIRLSVTGLGSRLSVVPDNRGNLLVADADNGLVRRIALTGGSVTIAGNGNWRYAGEGVTATLAPIGSPAGLAVAPDGSVYFSTVQSPLAAPIHRIQKISPQGVLSTVAGTGKAGFSGDGGPGALAAVNGPGSLAVDPAGNLYISDNGNNRIRKLTPAGTISTFVSGYAGALAVDPAGNLYEGSGTQVFRFDSQGKPTLVAGMGPAGTAGDGGPALNAALSSVVSIAFDPAGNLLIADFNGSSIRKVTPQGIIGTVAKSSGTFPTSVVSDRAGNIYFSQDGLSLARISTTGLLSVWSGPRSPLGDGKLATGVGFFFTGQMACDAAGNMFISDGYNYRVREILATQPSMRVSPQTLSFSAPSGGAPATAAISIQGSLAGLEFLAAAKTSDGADWLTVEAGSASTPRELSVLADPSGLAPGIYSGTITITPAAATPATLTVGVTFTVGPAQSPQLFLDHPNLSFSYPKNTSARSVTEVVSNAGGGSVNFTVAASNASSTPWLSVSPSSGTATPGKPASVAISANPAGLAPGAYTGTVVFTPDSGLPLAVPVTMTISAASQGLLLTQTGMTFTAVAQGGVVPPQSFGVVNTGTGTLPWKASTSTLSGGQWLQAAPGSGLSDPALAAPQVVVTVNPVGLAPGDYYGLVRIDAPGAANTPQVVTASLQVLPAGSNPGTVVQPTELVFASTPGDALNGSPSSQNLTLYNLAGTTLTYRTDSTAGLGPYELFVAPQLGTIDQAHPATVTVQPIYQYSGTTTFEFSDGRVQPVKITNVLATGAQSTAHSARLHPQTPSCAPSQIMIALTTLPPSFDVSAGWPVALSVDAMDDCGNPHLSGSVSVAFSNGDPTLPLHSLNNGTWQATWPTHANPQPVSLTITAVNDALGIQGTRQIDGSLSSQKDPPVFTQDGIVSAASPVSYVALAPGSIFSIYGNRLAENAAAAQNIPLPDSLANTTVVIGDKVAPLFYADQGQINAVVPYGLNPDTTHYLLVQRGLTYSQPVPVDVAPAQPGVFTAGGAAIAFAYRGTAPAFLVTAQAPATAGDVLVLYCGGLGIPSQSVTDGAASPPATVQDTVTVTIGGQDAPVAYAGLVSGLVGLYQVNLTVPSGITPGNAVPLTLSVSGQTSPPASLAVR